MNRIINRFGAPNLDNSVGYGAQVLNEKVSLSMAKIIKDNHLSPDEIIAFEHQMVLAVTATSSEALILEGIAMRKAAKSKKKEVIYTLDQ